MERGGEGEGESEVHRTSPEHIATGRKRQKKRTEIIRTQVQSALRNFFRVAIILYIFDYICKYCHHGAPPPVVSFLGPRNREMIGGIETTGG